MNQIEATQINSKDLFSTYQKNIDKMGKNFKIEYSKYGDIENNLYTMIHPIYLYVVDEKGKYKMQIAHTIKPELAIDLIIKKLGK